MIMSSPAWANWFLEVEDQKYPPTKDTCDNDAEFHFDLLSVKGALTFATEDVIEELTQHPYPDVGSRCEITMGELLIRLTRVQ